MRKRTILMAAFAMAVGVGVTMQARAQTTGHPAGNAGNDYSSTSADTTTTGGGVSNDPVVSAGNTPTGTATVKGTNASTHSHKTGDDHKSMDKEDLQSGRGKMPDSKDTATGTPQNTMAR